MSTRLNYYTPTAIIHRDESRIDSKSPESIESFIKDKYNQQAITTSNSSNKLLSFIAITFSAFQSIKQRERFYRSNSRNKQHWIQNQHIAMMRDAVYGQHQDSRDEQVIPIERKLDAPKVHRAKQQPQKHHLGNIAEKVIDVVDWSKNFTEQIFCHLERPDHNIQKIILQGLQGSRQALSGPLRNDKIQQLGIGNERRNK